MLWNQSIILSIVFLPFFSFCALFGFGRFLGRKGAYVVALGSIFLAFILSLLAIKNVAVLGKSYFIKLGVWFRVGDLVVDWGYMFDPLCLFMFGVVTLVSCCVHFYSVDYMSRDSGFIRFMALISLFTFFMLILVSADNFVLMLVGWEGIGICSFLLVGFWWSRPQAIKAAIKALVYNRVGDCGFLIGLFLLFKYFRTFNLDVLFLVFPYLNDVNVLLFGKFSVPLTSLCAFFLFFGVIGKSAQIGLHCWLPDAMEGPTPVSALLHSATMVTAGIFLVLRCSFMFELCPSILMLMLFFGGVTVFFGSIVGLTQFDIKKIIAYSTCSQLGYMLVACGCSNYLGAFFHLVNHAFIKALLFLVSGVVISKLYGEQDIRRMGGLQKLMPLSYVFMLIGSLSLAGFPFLSGYYSKDIIIEAVSTKFHISFFLIFWLISLSTFLTSFYSFRLIFLVFITKTNIPFTIFYKIKDMSFFVFLPLGLLAFLSIFSGYFLFDLFFGAGSDIFQDVLVHSKGAVLREVELVPDALKLLPSFFSFLGIFAGMYFDVLVARKFCRCVVYSRGLNSALYIDSFFNRGIVMPLLRFALVICFRLIDKYFLEIFGAKGLFYILKMVFFSNATLVGGRLERIFFLTLYIILMFFILSWFGFF